MLEKSLSLKFFKNHYWNIAFLFFVFSWFIPAKFGFFRTVFYAFIGIPVLFNLRRADFLVLLKQKSIWPLIALCAYAIVFSIDLEIMLDMAKSTLILLLLLFFSLKLPLGEPATVKKISFLLVVIVVVYILSNALYQYYSTGWRFGERLDKLFGRSRSVIYTADFLMCVLVSYNWGCIKMRDFKLMFLVNALSLAVAMIFLQSRSIIPAGVGCFLLFIATEVRCWRNAFKAIFFIGLLGATIWLILFLGEMAHSVTGRGGSYRLEIWSAYLTSTLECGAITGCGWGRELGLIAMADGTPINNPHSMYMQHFYWGGVVGLSLLLACILTPLVKGIRLSSYAVWPLLAGCIAMAFDGRELISMPAERWYLVLIPLTLLIGQIAQAAASNGGSAPTGERRCLTEGGGP